MKKLFFIGLILFVGCSERMPNDLKAQITAEKLLDTLYRPNKVEDKMQIGFINITDYLDPSKKDYANRSRLGTFQSIISSYRPSANEWTDFTRKATDILSKDKGSTKGAIILESYKVQNTKYVAAFFVDSTFRKVSGRIQL